MSIVSIVSLLAGVDTLHALVSATESLSKKPFPN
jgi:hypothetical protein